MSNAIDSRTPPGEGDGTGSGPVDAHRAAEGSAVDAAIEAATDAVTSAVLDRDAVEIRFVHGHPELRVSYEAMADAAVRAAEPILRQAVAEELVRTSGLTVRTQVRRILVNAGNFPSDDQLDAMTQEIIDLIVPAARLQERPRAAEEIARAIEVAQGDRCPECRGKAASKKWARNPNRTVGRCGGGHTWEIKHSGAPYWSPAAIAREIGARDA